MIRYCLHLASSWHESHDKPRQCVEKHSANEGAYSQGCGLSSGHVWMWELDHKEGRASKNWCLRTVVMGKTPESPLDSKGIKPVNLKGSTLNTHWKDWCWSWNSSILVIWCKQLTHWKSPWMLGKIEGRRRKGYKRMRWLDSITNAMNTDLGKLLRCWGTGRPGVLQSMGSQRVRHNWATEQQ